MPVHVLPALDLDVSSACGVLLSYQFSLSLNALHSQYSSHAFFTSVFPPQLSLLTHTETGLVIELKNGLQVCRCARSAWLMGNRSTEFFAFPLSFLQKVIKVL